MEKIPGAVLGEVHPVSAQNKTLISDTWDLCVRVPPDFKHVTIF